MEPEQSRDDFWRPRSATDASTHEPEHLLRQAGEPTLAPEPGPLEQAKPIHPRGGARDLLRRILAPIAGAGLLLVKFATKFKLLLVALPKIKFVGTAGSALVSIGLYAIFWGWPFAALFVLLLFVHELGHVIWLRREGVPATAPMFIPFLGAVVGMKGLPDDAYVEAKVGLAGPILGTIGAAAVWLLGLSLHSHLLEAVAYTGFLLNLFNLLPVVPLDGGRAMAAVHPSFWIAGLLGLAVLMFISPNPILLIILVVGGMEALSRFRRRKDPDPARARYYKVRPVNRVVIATVYLGLAAVLVLAMQASHVPRPRS